MLNLFFTAGAHDVTLEELMNDKGHIDYDNFISGGKTDDIMTKASTFGDGLWLFTELDDAKHWSEDQPVFKVDIDETKYNVVKVDNYDSKENISTVLRYCSEFDKDKLPDMIMIPRETVYNADVVFEALQSCNGTTRNPLTGEDREKAIEKNTDYIFNWFKALKEKDMETIKSEEYSWAYDSLVDNFEDGTTEDEVLNGYEPDKGLHWAVIFSKKLMESLEFVEV